MAQATKSDGRTALAAAAPGDAIEISEQELTQRKAFLELHEEDVSNLTGINEQARRYADAVIDDFYRHLLSFER